jgi:uncharacterized protein
LHVAIEEGSGRAEAKLEGRSNFSIVERSMPIVAVSSEEKGAVGNLSLKLIPGNNNILINTNPFLETDLQYAVNTAVTYAKLHAPGYQYDRDFIFDFKEKEAQLIGGGSAGAAAAILTIATLDGKALKKEAVITGTINPDGTVGKVGDVLEKAKAVSDAGYKYFLVPKGQARITYYERQAERQPSSFGFDIIRTRYVPKTLDLRETAREEWGLNMVEVSSIDEALPYFIAS